MENTQRQFTELYDRLGISVDASADDIKKAYRRKSMECHPDKVANLGEAEQIEAKAKFEAIKEAYDILSNPMKRKAYDETGKTEHGDIDKAISGFINQHIIPFIIQFEETAYEKMNMVFEINGFIDEIISQCNKDKQKFLQEKKKLEKFLGRMNPKPGTDESENGCKAKSMFQPRIMYCQQMIDASDQAIEIANTVKETFDSYDFVYKEKEVPTWEPDDAMREALREFNKKMKTRW